jgi:ABC-2 type transport system permease protein
MTTTSLNALPEIRVRRGLKFCLRSYAVLLRSDVTNLRVWLPLFVVVQALMGAGMAIMYGFFMPEAMLVERAVWIATGAPTLALIPVGMTMVPARIGQLKLAGMMDFHWSQPVPRMAAVASIYTVFTLAALPGVALTLAVATWRYGIELAISPAIVPAILLASITATSVGYAMGIAGEPRVINLLSNIVIFFVLLFSPIVYRLEQLPGPYQAVQQALPFYPMAVVIRDGLSDGLVDGTGAAYAVLAAWALVGLAVTAVLVGRRG